MKTTLAIAAVLVALGSASCGGGEVQQRAVRKPAAMVIRETELARIHALVAGDVDRAGALTADDFLLDSPDGETLTKDRYLGAVGSGGLDYVTWEAITPVRVAVDGDEAVVRYRSKIGFAGNFGGTTEQSHEDVYERRGGHWLIVRSKTTFDG